MSEFIPEKLNSFLPETFSSVNAIAESAAKVAYYNFKWQHVTFIIFNVTHFYGINIFSKLYNKNLELYNVMKENQGNHHRFIENSKQFVLFADDVTDIVGMIERLTTKKFNSNAKIIIVCKERNRCDETNAVEALWKYRIVNVVFINYYNIVNIYTYYFSEQCGHSTPRRLSHWDDCIYSNKNNSKACLIDMFPIKLKNLYGCPLIVSTFPHYPYMFLKNGKPFGADGLLLRIIMKSLNGTLVLITPRDGDGWGGLQNDSTWSGSLGDVYYDLANISMTSASITLNRYKYFDLSIHYNTIQLLWITHPLDYQFSSFKLVKPFTFRGRIFLIVISLLIILTHIFFKTKVWKVFGKRFNIDQSSDGFFMYSLQISLGLPVARFSAKHFYKYLTLFWIWYWLFIRTIYQVYLINSLQTDVRVNNINTIRNAIAEGYLFGSGTPLKDYYIDDPIIYSNWTVVESNKIYPLMHNLTKGMKFILGINAVTVKIFLRETHLDLHVLSEKILESPAVLYLKKNSCLTRAINTVLTRLFESGIPNKIFQYYTFTPPRSKGKKNERITYDHLKGCFGILILGWIASIIIFLIENLVGRKNNVRVKPNELVIYNK